MTDEPLNLAILLSGGGRTLQNLIEEMEEGSLHAKIQVVLSSTKNSGDGVPILIRKDMFR